MMLLSCSNLAKSYGERTLFQGVSFTVYDHDKIGFVGANGVGKSTLFRLLQGEEHFDKGELSYSKKTRIGVVEQYLKTEESANRSLLEEVLIVFDAVTKTEERLRCLEEKMERSGGTPEDIELQFSLRQQWENAGGLTYRSRARAALLGLGFSPDDLILPFSALSGGQQTKACLCKLLLSDANLLLLDEPTNHLDLEASRWLEGFLQSYEGSFMVISHDRYFLDRVTNQTYALEHGRFASYKGNYSSYKAQKAQRDLTLRREYDNAQKEIHRLEGVIAQQRQWNREKNIRTAESKQKVIDRLQAGLVSPDAAAADLKMSFAPRKISGREVMTVQNLAKGFGGAPLFRQVEFMVYRGDRIFLLGPNGCGKTTLLKTLLGEYSPSEGQCKLGVHVEIGYYDQTQTGLHDNLTVLQELQNAYPHLTETQLRNALAAFLFFKDDVFKSISTLSGGERARVLLLRLMLSGANVLLLDEPTNHLDIASREALEEALLQYEGTVLAVSHDRYFVNRLATRVFFLQGQGITCRDGNYDDYLASCAAGEATPESLRTLTSSAGSVSEQAEVRSRALRPGSQEYKEQKERQSALRRQRTRVTRLEEEIHALEDSVSQTQEQLASPEIAAEYEQVIALHEQLIKLKNELETRYSDWEEAGELLSSMEQEDSL